jgi:hypothetical protein
MKLLAFTYIPFPIMMGSVCDVSTLPPYTGGILIATMIVMTLTLICLCLSMAFRFFDHEYFSDLYLKCCPILLCLSVLLIGIAILCALIGL